MITEEQYKAAKQIVRDYENPKAKTVMIPDSYERARDGNCTSKKAKHMFSIVPSAKAKLIRKEHPTWTIALWECMFCHKIIESM